jgi:hypothetical protein
MHDAARITVPVAQAQPVPETLGGGLVIKRAVMAGERPSRAARLEPRRRIVFQLLMRVAAGYRHVLTRLLLNSFTGGPETRFKKAGAQL